MGGQRSACGWWLSRVSRQLVKGQQAGGQGSTSRWPRVSKRVAKSQQLGGEGSAVRWSRVNVGGQGLAVRWTRVSS